MFNMPETNVIFNVVNQMKKIVLVAVALYVTVSGFAQNTADVGIWGGTSTYIGDMQELTPFQSFRPNIGAIFRYNFNQRVGMRAQFITGNFSAEGLVEEEPWSYSKSVQELSLQVEINFLRYRLGDRKTPFSPYILGGVGVMYFPYELDPALLFPINPGHNKGTNVTNESVVALSMPFGFGLKTHIGDRFGIGIEYLMRKHFVDKLDNLDDPGAYINEQGIEYMYNDFWHNNDWSGYLGVYITYKINLGNAACPAYDSIRR
jgi:hypothetical protein